jgi:hypothetical protein
MMDKESIYWLIPPQVQGMTRYMVKLHITDYENRVEFDRYRPNYNEKITYLRAIRWLQLN